MTTESTEVQEMAARERARWLTVAEAQALRKRWDEMRDAVDRTAEKFDGDPEGETEAFLFVFIAAMCCDGFMRAAAEAARKIAELRGATREGDGS